jgi:hypothetical protein
VACFADATRSIAHSLRPDERSVEALFRSLCVCVADEDENDIDFAVLVNENKEIYMYKHWSGQFIVVAQNFTTCVWREIPQ